MGVERVIAGVLALGREAEEEIGLRLSDQARETITHECVEGNFAALSALAKGALDGAEDGADDGALEAVGLDGDMLEAQAFAHLAVRVARGLPTSCPGTTGVRAGVSGGTISRPSNAIRTMGGGGA